MLVYKIYGMGNPQRDIGRIPLLLGNLNPKLHVLKDEFCAEIKGS